MPTTIPTTDAFTNSLSSNLTSSTGRSSSYFANTFNAKKQKNSEAGGAVKVGNCAESAMSDSADAASKLGGATKACSSRKESTPEERLNGGNLAAVKGGVLEGESLTYDASQKANCGYGTSGGKGQVR